MMKRFLVALVFAGAMGQAAAQSPVKLTFQDAVKLGLDFNVNLQQQRNNLMGTQLSKTSAMLQMAPSVEAQASAGRFDGNSFNQQLGEVINGKTDFLNASVSANLPIFNGFNQFNAFRQSQSANEAQLNFVKRTQQDVIRNVAFQFLTCLLDQQLVTIDQQSLETQKAQYQQIKAQVDLGARAEADLYNQEFQVKNAEVLLVRSSNRLKNDKAILAQTLLIDPIISFDLEEISWDIASFTDELQVDQMNTEAMQYRADLRQAEFTAQAAKFGLSSVRGRFYPNLSAFGQLNSRYNFIYGYPDNRTFDQQFRSDNRQLYYGLQLRVPIFNGLISRSQVMQSKILFENAQINAKSAEIRVKTEVLLAYQNFNDARTNYVAAEAQLKAGKLAYEMEKERFDLGISNIVQLTTAQQSYVRAQSDYASARYTLMLQKIMINYALGTLKIEDIP